MEDCLPADFAEKILELESELDGNHSLDVVRELNQLYRIGIDYYVGVDPMKARHFQRRMTKMLADPMTLALIEAKTEERVLKTKTMKLSCKIKDEVSRFENGSQSYIKCLLEKSEKARHNYERAKRNTLIDQEETLKNRRLLKKSRSQSKLECKENNCFEIPYYHQA